MMEKNPAEISLRVPGTKEYVLVIRTALGGVAILKDLGMDTLDDLRTAADEACDCLLHQGRRVEAMEVSVRDSGHELTVSLEAEFVGEKSGDCQENTDISRAVLETLVTRVNLTCEPCGCVSRIDLTLPKAG